ncbi:MAG: hypothetical protein ABI743_14750, partial [bacterium]
DDDNTTTVADRTRGRVISEGRAVNGSVHQFPAQGVKDVEDWYQIPLTGGREYFFTLGFSLPGQDSVELRIVDPTGVVLRTARSAAGINRAAIVPAQVGTDGYYVQVVYYGSPTSAAFGSYSFTVTSQPIATTTWATHVPVSVATGVVMDDVVVLDHQGQPLISYRTHGTAPGYQRWFARALTTLPTTAADWSIHSAATYSEAWSDQPGTPASLNGRLIFSYRTGGPFPDNCRIMVSLTSTPTSAVDWFGYDFWGADVKFFAAGTGHFVLYAITEDETLLWRSVTEFPIEPVDWTGLPLPQGVSDYISDVGHMPQPFNGGFSMFDSDSFAYTSSETPATTTNWVSCPLPASFYGPDVFVPHDGLPSLLATTFGSSGQDGLPVWVVSSSTATPLTSADWTTTSLGTSGLTKISGCWVANRLAVGVNPVNLNCEGLLRARVPFVTGPSDVQLVAFEPQSGIRNYPKVLDHGGQVALLTQRTVAGGATELHYSVAPPGF